jgi:hypothetical protein
LRLVNVNFGLLSPPGASALVTPNDDDPLVTFTKQVRDLDSVTIVGTQEDFTFINGRVHASHLGSNPRVGGETRTNQAVQILGRELPPEAGEFGIDRYYGGVDSELVGGPEVLPGAIVNS